MVVVVVELGEFLEVVVVVERDGKVVLNLFFILRIVKFFSLFRAVKVFEVRAVGGSAYAYVYRWVCVGSVVWGASFR